MTLERIFYDFLFLSYRGYRNPDRHTQREREAEKIITQRFGHF